MSGTITLSQLVPESWTRVGLRPVVSYSCGHYGNGLGSTAGGKRRKVCPPCQTMLRAEPSELVRIAMNLAGYEYQPNLMAPDNPITFEKAEAVRIEAERRAAIVNEARKHLNPSRLKTHGGEGYLKSAAA